MNSVYWLILTIILLIVELSTMALTTIWFAGGAVIAFFASLLGVGTIAQWVIFIIISCILLLLTRPLALKHVKGKTQKTNVDALIGLRAQVMETVDNTSATGVVSVNGQIWTARSYNDGETFEKEQWVVIEAVQGVKLLVKGEN